jgi:Tol biopolymer transport system component
MDANPEFDYACDLSPDSTSIAVLTRVPRSDGKIESSTGPIRVLSLNGKPERKIWIKGRNDFRTFVDWSSDGKNLILARLTDGGPELISTDLSGNANVLWHVAGTFPLRAVSSPDGQHLAILCRGDSNNVWLLENF